MPINQPPTQPAHPSGGLFTAPATARDRLIVALDFPEADPAARMAATLGHTVGWFKVGKQLFTAAGPDLVRSLIGQGHKVFLDLKFHDIPATVAGAVRAAAELGVGMLTVHASGGSVMLRAAVEAAGQSPQPPLVLAVTVLTSMREADLAETGVPGRLLDQAQRLAELAHTAGCGGIVASAHEAAEIRRRLGDGFAIVTPGIRPATSSNDDQARVLTPAGAIRAGATHLVVGRPITQAQDPQQAAQEIVAEIAGALK